MQKRAQVSLDGIWRFIPAAEGAASPKLGWAYIKVPGTWQSSRPADRRTWSRRAAVRSGTFMMGRACRAPGTSGRSVPAEWQGRAISLRFDRVCTDAMVYVNGRECGKSPGPGAPWISPQR